MIATLIAAVVALGLVNGANDTMKGVATLVGSGSARVSIALTLGIGATLAGSIAALWLAHELAHRFAGTGVVAEALIAQPEFRTATALGAAAVVGLATRVGMPVSTTHALVGALVGAGSALAGAGAVGWTHVLFALLAPLLVSPILAAAVAWTGRRRAAAVASSRRLHHAHVASAAAVSFARGLNDAPKIAGLLVLIGGLGESMSLGLAAASMAIGAAIGARRVGETMAHGITALDARDGAIANFATAAMVLIASPLGLPVSTTHVSVASLAGVGAAGRGLTGPTLGRIALAWVVTLPLAALAAFAVAHAVSAR